MLPCGHAYHAHCIDRWLLAQFAHTVVDERVACRLPTCPLCKQVPVTETMVKNMMKNFDA